MTKAVILAGGLGTRLMEETVIRPKPMVEIGGKPILWHIMKYYATYGITDFVICGGYKQETIKDFFANYTLHNSDVTFDLVKGTVKSHTNESPDWKVSVINTGADTMTAGRLYRAREYIGNETFCMTYGDGLSDVDITALIAHHKKTGGLVTLTAVHTPPRFGELDIEDGKILHFMEKMTVSASRVNGGYMVMEPGVFSYLENCDGMMLEQEPLRRIARDGQLRAFNHDGFWQCMDNLREKQLLEDHWASGKAPWKKWN